VTVAFRQWLEQQVGRDDAVGDLARDLAEDGCLPSDANDYFPVKRHIEQEHSPCDKALAVLHGALIEWVHVEWAKYGKARLK
jgi:uncharacterized protein YozE (UPF0346 family)